MAAGMIEYWRSTGHVFPEEDVDFSSKLDTDLYAHAKAKTAVQSLEVSRGGSQFVTWSSDRYSSGLLACKRNHLLPRTPLCRLGPLRSCCWQSSFFSNLGFIFNFVTARLPAFP